MTLGQRIQELRKQRGLSQEALGETLGVSRQAVSKWEGDNGIPELDTLIAMSRLFGVTIGHLLGVEAPINEEIKTAEENSRPAAAESTEQPPPIEEILRRYVEQTSKNSKHSHLIQQRWLAVAALVFASVCLVMLAQFGSLRNTVRLLRSELSNLQVHVSNSQNNLSGQIRNTIYDVLAEEAQLLSTFQWELAELDLDHQTAALRMSATMKEYTAGSKLQFLADWQKVDGSEGQTVGEWADGPNFQSEITIPLNHNTVIKIRVEDTLGNIKEQALPTPIYELHPDHFRLSARNLTAPFAISVKGFGISAATTKGEQAHILIDSIFPQFIQPKKAELSAFLNGVEVMREVMIIVPSDREPQSFKASIRDNYFDLSLRDGDVLDVVLVTTDNLGHTEQFTDCISVKNGKINRSPAEAPTIYVGE